MKLFGLEIASHKDMNAIREDVRLMRRQIEDIGWTRIGSEQGDSKSLIGVSIHEIITRSRRAWIHNPLVGHGVNLTTWFVFGQGVSEPKAEDERVQDVISKFWNDPSNRKVLTSPDAQQSVSNKLQYDGQLFFALFTNVITGETRVRILDPLTIQDVIRDPDDNMRPRLYKQMVSTSKYNFQTGQYELTNLTNQFRFLPDIDLGDPEMLEVPDERKGWDRATKVAVYHVKINCDPLDKWGMPETFRTLDWVQAHKDMASDLATLIRSQATWAWKKKVQGTQSQINVFKNALQMVQNQSVPRPVVGSVQIENENVDLEPIDTPQGGANIMQIGLRQMRLVVSSGFGIFEHYFGDAGNANLASTKAMELPMLKKFLARQIVWEGVFDRILQYVIDQAIVAGTLSGSAVVNRAENRLEVETPIDRMVDIDFPPILDQDLSMLANALSTAKEGGLIPSEAAARLFMLGANINNVEQELENLNAEEEERKAEQKERFGNGEASPDDAGVDGFLKKLFRKKEQGDQAQESARLRKLKKPFALADKSKVVKRGLRAYENALVGAFERFSSSIPKQVRVVGPLGAKRAQMADVDAQVDRFLEDMQMAARRFFPEAIRLGAGFVYSQVNKGIEEMVRETNESSFLEDRLSWNARYVYESLGKDMKEAIRKAMLGEFPDDEAAAGAIRETLRAFGVRVRQYAGAYWTVEEKAVKEFGSKFDLMVNFIGPEDETNCPDCAAAVAGGPFRIAEAPVPGEDTVCRGNCRHALQIVGQAAVAA